MCYPEKLHLLQECLNDSVLAHIVHVEPGPAAFVGQPALHS